MTDTITTADIDRIQASSIVERCHDAAMLLNARCLINALMPIPVEDALDLLGAALTHLLFDDLEGCSFFADEDGGQLAVYIDGPESIIVDGAEVHLGSPDIAVNVGWPHRRCTGEDVQAALSRLEKIMHPDLFA